MEQNKTKHETKHVDFLVLSGTASFCFLNKFPKSPHKEIEEKHSISKFVRQTGVIGCERALSADNVRQRADVIGSRVTIPPITCEKKYLMNYERAYLRILFDLFTLQMVLERFDTWENVNFMHYDGNMW